MAKMLINGEVIGEITLDEQKLAELTQKFDLYNEYTIEPEAEEQESDNLYEGLDKNYIYYAILKCHIEDDFSYPLRFGIEEVSV